MFNTLHNVRWAAYSEGVQPSHQALRQQRHPVPAAPAVAPSELPPLEIQISPPHPTPPASSKPFCSPGWGVMDANQANHYWSSSELAGLNLLPDASQQLPDLLFCGTEAAGVSHSPRLEEEGAAKLGERLGCVVVCKIGTGFERSCNLLAIDAVGETFPVRNVRIRFRDRALLPMAGWASSTLMIELASSL